MILHTVKTRVEIRFVDITRIVRDFRNNLLTSIIWRDPES